MSREEGQKDLDFTQLVELNDQFDQQLKELKDSDEPVSGSSQKTFSFKKGVVTLLAVIAALIIPFIVLVRTSVYVYGTYQLNGWLALTAGIGATILLLICYALFIAYRYGNGIGIHKYIIRGIIMLVTAYSLYGVLYYSSMNTKTDEITSYYRSLHPIMRVALTSITLADNNLVVTDIQREPEDYAQMGLPENQHSLHYVQSNGYVHAVDLRTKGRAEWKNWLTRAAFNLVGLQSIRHVGTADHLHVYLPLNQK